MIDYDSNTANQLVNDAGGTVQYAGGANAVAYVQVGSSNAGTVSVSGATATLNYGGGSGSSSDSGQFTAGAGSTLDLGGPRTESTGATISGAGTVDVTGATTFNAASNLTSSGTFQVDGSLSAASGITVSTTNLTLNGYLNGPGSFAVSGPATLGNSSFLGTYGTAGTGVHLTVSGATSVPGYVYLSAGSELENNGTLTLSDGAYLYDYDSAGNSFVNDSGGTLSYPGSSGQTAYVGVTSPNAGLVKVTGGTLNYGGGSGSGSDTGQFTAAAGTTLDLGGTRTEQSGATISGAGTVDITGAVTFNAASNLTNTGTFQVDGSLSAASGITVNTTNLTLNGYLIGPGSFAVSGPATLGSSSFLGTYGAAGTAVHLTVSGATSVLGYVYLSAGSELENNGTLTLSDGAYLYDYDGGGNSFVNDSGGTLSYPGGSGQTAYVGVTSPNAGLVKVTGGTLNYGGGSGSGSDTGQFSAGAGSTLDLGGTRAESTGATVSGAGTVDITGAVTFNAASNLTNTGTFQVDGSLSAASGITVNTTNLTLNGSLVGPGSFAVSGSATLTNPGLGSYPTSGTGVHLTVSGSTSVTGTAYLQEGSTLENSGTLTMADSSNLADYDGLGNQFVNDTLGTITHNGAAGGSSTISVTFNNQGTLQSVKGTLNAQGLSNLSSGTLTGGTYDTEGGILGLPAGVTTNAANVILGASPSAINVAGTSTNALVGLLSNSGSLDVKRSLTDNSALTNTGTLTVEGGTFIAKPFTQTSGQTTVLTGATLESGSGSSNLTISGGTLTGNGQLLGNLTGAGKVVPTGSSGGPMTLTGTYKPTGTLSIPISGTTTAGVSYGQLSETGAATLGGTLALVTANGFTPPIGSTFTVLKATSITGSFSSITGTDLGDRSYSVSTNATSVVATVIPQPPTVSGVSPSIGAAGGGTSVTITGTRFVGVTGVSFGGNPATSYTVTDSGHITATAPAGTGTVDVTVTTAGGTSATSNADQYTYAPPPTVTGVSPSQGPASGGTSVTITGTGFTGASAVSFGSTAATSYSVTDSSHIAATAPAGTGTVDVTVTTVGGTSSTSSADQYTFVPAPTVSGVSPSSGPTGGTNSVTITGTGFTGASAVKFGGTAATGYSVTDDSHITATAPAGTGTVDVTVTTVGGTSATSSADQYTYVAAPTVSGVSPNTGSDAGGTSVTITGTGFTAASAVKFGATAASSVSVTDSSHITATSPAGTGTVDVTVTTPGGTSPTSSADQFTYVSSGGAPTVTNVNPSAGPITAGQVVTVQGTNFVTGATTVKFGTTAGTSVNVGSPTQLTVTAPAHAAGTVDVVVTTAQGSSATGAADKYTFAGKPTVTLLNPTGGAPAGGNTVVITGTNFTSGATVVFGTTPASPVTVNSATKITVTAPAHAAAAVDVKVTAAGGTSAVSAKDKYTYAGIPTVTSVSPSDGTTGGGETIVVKGTNFVSGAVVSFGSTPATSTTYNSATQLTAVAPAHAAGTVDVTVATVGGTSATSTKDTYAFGPATITSFAPTSGVTGSTVTITGTGFTAGTAVKFTGPSSTTLASPKVTFTSGTSIKAVVPNGAVTGPITVNNGQGDVASATNYKVTLSITGLSPTSGPVGTTVVISGVGFTVTSVVRFNGTQSVSVNHVSATEMDAVVPSGATTGSVTVQNTTAPIGKVTSPTPFTVG